MRKLFLVLMLLGLTTPLMAQDPIELSEVVIRGTNYKYLNATDYTEAALPVYVLEREAAKFSAEGRDVYVDEFGTFSVSFFIPDGKIVALYDEEGTILKTVERYTNVQLPTPVIKALNDRYPNWDVIKDVYHVKYSDEYGAEKFFVVKLKNNNKRMKVKIDDVGMFL